MKSKITNNILRISIEEDSIVSIEKFTFKNAREKSARLAV